MIILVLLFSSAFYLPVHATTLIDLLPSAEKDLITLEKNVELFSNEESIVKVDIAENNKVYYEDETGNTDYILILDVTSSHLTAAKSGIAKFLKDKDFNVTVCSFGENTELSDQVNAADGISLINNLTSSGITANYEKLLSALKGYLGEQDSTRHKKIILFTDSFSLTETEIDSVENLIEYSQLNNTSIYPIGIGLAENSTDYKILNYFTTSTLNVFNLETTNITADIETTANIIEQAPIGVYASDRVLIEKVNDNFTFKGFDISNNEGSSLISTENIVTFENGIVAEFNKETNTITATYPMQYEDNSLSFTYYVQMNESIRYSSGTYSPSDTTTLNYTECNGIYHLEEREESCESVKYDYNVFSYDVDFDFVIEHDDADLLSFDVYKIVNEDSSYMGTIDITNFSDYVLNSVGNKALCKVDDQGNAVSYDLRMNSTNHIANDIIINENKISITLRPYRAKATLKKVDDETGQLLSGATFTIYEYDRSIDEYVPYTGNNTSLQTDFISVLKDNAGKYTSGYIYYSNKNKGKFLLIETKSPVGYAGDYESFSNISESTAKKTYYFSISEDDAVSIISTNTYNGEAVFANTKVFGEITVDYLDNDTKKNIDIDYDAEFNLYAAADIFHPDGITTNINYQNEQSGLLYKTDDLVASISYDNDGYILGNLYPGKYYVVQTKASEGYLKTSEKYYCDVSYVSESVVTIRKTVALTNHAFKNKLTFSRSDFDNDCGFVIYNLADIGIENYTNEEAIQYIIDNYRNTSTAKYELIGIPPATIYQTALTSDVTKDISLYDTDYHKTTEGEYFCNILHPAKGIVTTPMLTYGNYLVVQVEYGDMKNSIKPFIINVSEDYDDSEVIGDGLGSPLASITLPDPTSTTMLQIQNTDLEGNAIDGTSSFIIKDTNSTWYDYYMSEESTLTKVFYKAVCGTNVSYKTVDGYIGTQKNPYVVKQEEDGSYICELPFSLPAGQYEIIELTAPTNYVKRGYEGTFNVDTSGNIYYEGEKASYTSAPSNDFLVNVDSTEWIYDEILDANLIKVNLPHQKVTGRIDIQTLYQAIDGVKDDTVFDRLLKYVKGDTEFKNVEFTYNNISCSDVTFQFYDKFDTNKEDLLFSIKTNGKGNGFITDIPLGDYLVDVSDVKVQTYAPNKNFNISLKYVNDETPIISSYISYVLKSSTASINIGLKNVEEQFLADGQVGLYNVSSIKNIAGNVIVPANTLLAIASPYESSGTVYCANFTNMPNLNYVVKSITPPTGYLNSSGQANIIADTTTKERINRYRQDITYSTTGVKLTILDENESLLSGAEFNVLDEYGTIKERITTGKETLISGSLISGNTYYLKQTKAPAGYVMKTEKISFVPGKDVVESLVISNKLKKINIVCLETSTNSTDEVDGLNDFSNLKTSMMATLNPLLDTSTMVVTDTITDYAGYSVVEGVGINIYDNGTNSRSSSRKLLKLLQNNVLKDASFTLKSNALVVMGLDAGNYLFSISDYPTGYVGDKEQLIYVNDTDEYQTVVIGLQKAKITANAYIYDGEKLNKANSSISVTNSSGKTVATLSNGNTLDNLVVGQTYKLTVTSGDISTEQTVTIKSPTYNYNVDLYLYPEEYLTGSNTSTSTVSNNSSNSSSSSSNTTTTDDSSTTTTTTTTTASNTTVQTNDTSSSTSNADNTEADKSTNAANENKSFISAIESVITGDKKFIFIPLAITIVAASGILLTVLIRKRGKRRVRNEK